MDDLGGVKGAAVTPGGQKFLKLKEPLGAILRGNGRFEAKDKPVLKLKDWPGLKIETEIGLVIGQPIDREPRSLNDFKKRVRAVIPVIELPAGRWTPNGGANAVDLAAVNVTSAAYIVGEPIDPRTVDPRKTKISLHKNGRELHTATGEDCWNGPWETGLWLSKFALRQGITLKPGQIITCGALGKIQPGSRGRFKAEYGNLGTIEFTLR
ncbi:MAG: fumarylacetoacetate hydrolase family protein [Limisphaerales bacterium]